MNRKDNIENDSNFNTINSNEKRGNQAGTNSQGNYNNSPRDNSSSKENKSSKKSNISEKKSKLS